MNQNIILNVDSYKASHFLQYPPGISHISSYIESRGGSFDQTVFFGLQLFIKNYLLKPITQDNIDEAEELFLAHGEPFNRKGWEYILNKYAGFLPLEIQAVAEGTIIPTKNVLVQVVNTDPHCAWLTSYIETALLRAIWYPTTVATLSWHCKQIIKNYLEITADNSNSLNFKLHDFGARGVSSAETASIGGLAHLVNFLGTDTVSAVVAAKCFYHEPMAGFSIPAAEHSTITSWGKPAEAQAYANMLKQFAGPGKLVAVVSDSYNLWHAIDTIWGKELKQQVINNGGTLVIRPDSGDPIPVINQTIERLMHHFGFDVNTKGYRMLPAFIRVIQGDGIDLHSIEAILKSMQQAKLSAENITFGMGAALLQKVNRDTQKFAMKASAINIMGQWQDVFKDPITDPGKKSKKGRLALIKTDVGDYLTIRESSLGQYVNELISVYKNGKLLVEHTLTEIRERTLVKM